MAVAKLSKSGKQVQFIDEEGNLFGTSVVAIKNMLSGTLRGNFVLLTRMPYGVDPSRFKKSPVYEVPGYVAPSTGTPITASNDSLSDKSRKSNTEKKSFEDKKVW